MSFFQFTCPTRILSDVGLSQSFAHECELLNLTKLFCVTDQTLWDLNLCSPIFDHLQSNGVEIVGQFTAVPPNSSVETVKSCAKQMSSTFPQGILAIGGGSVIDTAKAANLLYTLGGDLKNDYAGAQIITQNLHPLIVMPTTAGTGSEVTEAMVIYDEDTQTKLSFVDHHLLPTLAILDAELTKKLPPLLTAATAVDALTHAIESIVSVQRGPVSEALAKEAITLIRNNLFAAIKQGENLEARQNLLVASTMAGLAFNHAMVGVVHAVAHSVGALAKVHHGTANGIFLPWGMEYNLDDVPDQLAVVAQCFGCTPEDDSHALALKGIHQVRVFLEELNQMCGFPLCYKEVGVKKEMLSDIANLAEQDGASFYNPRSVDAESLMPFLEKSFG